jgi:hypothetical protein
MLEKMIGSTSSSSNVYEFVDDNSNHYKSMMMNAWWRFMNESWLFM